MSKSQLEFLNKFDIPDDVKKQMIDELTGKIPKSKKKQKKK